MSKPSVDSSVKILGVKVHATSMDRALSRLETAVAENEKGYVCVTGVQGVMEAQMDTNLKRIINNALLTIPDGRPTVWVGWLRGLFQMRQVTGPTIMLRLCALSQQKGYTHFFYGGNDGVADQLKDALTQRFPGLNVVGTYTPPFRPLTADEEADLSPQSGGTEAGLFLGGIEHAEAGTVYGSIHLQARREGDVGRGSCIRHSHRSNQRCAVLDEGDGRAVDAPHLSGSETAVEAIPGQQSEVRLPDHAGTSRYSEAARGLGTR